MDLADASRLHLSTAQSAERMGAQGSEPLAQMLAVCRRLAGASDAFIFDSVGADRHRVVFDASPEWLPMAAEETLVRLLQEPGFMFSNRKVQWISPRESEDVLIGNLDSVGGTGRKLVLVFSGASHATLNAAADVMSDFVRLIETQLSLEHRIAEEERHQVARERALDHGNCGVIALRRDRSVLFANKAAADLIAKGDGLHVKRGTIRPSDFRHVTRFEEALDAVESANGAERHENGPAVAMLLPSRAGARPLVIVIVSAGSVETDASGAAVLLHLFQPGASALRGIDALAALHGLSRVETRLLAQLCLGLTVSEAAQVMRVKLETARAYLKQIFAKTGTHRQGELVLLMTGYLQAMRGDFDFVAV